MRRQVSTVVDRLLADPFLTSSDFETRARKRAREARTLRRIGDRVGAWRSIAAAHAEREASRRR